MPQPYGFETRSCMAFSAPEMTHALTCGSSAVAGIVMRPPSDKPMQLIRSASTSSRRVKSSMAQRQSRTFSPISVLPNSCMRMKVSAHKSLLPAFLPSRSPNGVKHGAVTT